MGLTIHYKLKQDAGDIPARQAVEQLRQTALDLSFKEVTELFELNGDACDYNQREQQDPLRWLLIQAGSSVQLDEHSSIQVAPTHLLAFSTWPGEGCEEANFGLCRYPATVIHRGKRIKTEDKAIERFKVWESEPSDDWLYFGTVHHHCSASAFQSSTDEQNEWNQDGLHITVGKMDAERHDLHARFYLAGNGYEPDLGSFWAIEPDLADRIPKGLHHHLAAFQMGERVTVDFPDLWRENLVEAVPEYRSLIPIRHWDEDEFRVPMMTRVDEALEDIHNQCSAMAVDEQEWMADLQNLVSNEVAQVILSACIKNQVTPESLLQVLSQSMLELEQG